MRNPVTMVSMLREAQAHRLELDWSLFAFAVNPAVGSVLARQVRGEYVLFVLRDEELGSVYAPAVLRKRLFLTDLRFLHAPAGNDGVPLGSDAEARCMAALLQFVRSRGLVDRISAPFNWCLSRSVPYGATASPFGSYVLDLAQSPGELWSGLHSKHRNGIRNASAQGAEIRHGAEQLPAFHRLYVSTMARSGMLAEPLTFFQSLLAAAPESAMCAVVFYRDVAQGGLFVPYSKAGAFYVYGASAESVTPTGAINFLHYETIMQLKERGACKYDFVGARLSDVSGTKLAGIQRFKERFGGQLERGCLWKLDLHPAKARVFDTLARGKAAVLGRKPGADIIDQEVLKANLRCDSANESV